MALAHFQRTFTDAAGNIKPGLAVTVRRESDNGLAALFADAGSVTAKSNPFNTDANGYGSFYVVDGRYRIQATDIDWRNEDLISQPSPNFTAMPQVGGDPIVESGSNSNGEYTKFADGTLQMWSYKSLSSGETVPAGGFQPALGQAGLEHTACVSSVGELLVLTEPRSGGYSYTEDMSSVVIGIDANNGRTNYRLYSVTGIRAGYTRGISFYAIGRWF